jgi:hypothetical protein
MLRNIMLDLPSYGVPDNLPQVLEQFFTNEMKELAQQVVRGLSSRSASEIINQYKQNPLFNGALGYLAWTNQDVVVIPIIYDVKKEDLPLIHFEWNINHPTVNLTFSNAYFVVFYNELYRFNHKENRLFLTKRGVILRALADLSYTPWNDFLLPISDQMTKDFLGLPLFDSGKLAKGGV